eukprot:Gb_24118 [translate_table: standard]
MECQSVAKASTEKSDQSHMEGKVDEGRLISAPDETLTCKEKKTDHRPAGQLVSNAIHHTHLPPNYVRSPASGQGLIKSSHYTSRYLWSTSNISVALPIDRRSFSRLDAHVVNTASFRCGALANSHLLILYR